MSTQTKRDRFDDLIGGGVPGGEDTQLQFNDAGVFGGASGLVYDKENDILGIGNWSINGNILANYFGSMQLSTFSLYAHGGGSSSYHAIDFDTTGYGIFTIWNYDTEDRITFNFSGITGNRVYTCPDASGTLGAVITKTDTGDPTGKEGLFCINTFDNTFKVYADSGWRSLATW